MASKKVWKSKIKKACTDAGTYREYFNGPIDTLASIMERRDKAVEQYEASGAVPIVKHTNKAGATNFERNPTLLVINECEKTALNYWRDLGLTPAGLKRIDDQSMKQKNNASFSDILSGLVNGE